MLIYLTYAVGLVCLLTVLYLLHVFWAETHPAEVWNRPQPGEDAWMDDSDDFIGSGE